MFCVRSNIRLGSRRRAGRGPGHPGLPDGALPPVTPRPLRAEGALLYVYPQRLLPAGGLSRCSPAGFWARGRLRLIADGRELWTRRVDALPERRLSLPFPAERLRGKRDVVMTLD